jgi:hypothetical protein
MMLGFARRERRMSEDRFRVWGRRLELAEHLAETREEVVGWLPTGG